ncbi:MAG: OB-fold domain-containing protein [Pseudaminobacter sp.]
MVDFLQPKVTDLNRPFWEGTAAGELRLQYCQESNAFRYPISRVCPICLSPDYEWRKVSGNGEIYTYMIFRRAYHPSFEGRVPYNVCMIQLDEGPRMFSNVVDGGVDVKIGQRVRVQFEERPGGIALPVFVLDQ